MSDTVHSQELYEMCKEHFNEPMISFGRLARCVGYGETGIDCYILVKHERGEVRWHTCVGGYTWLNRLKGQEYVKARNGEELDDLFRLDNELELNGARKEPKFVLKLYHDDMEHRALSPEDDE